ncbi:hypothetical protein BpHYR1_043118 [Brachionus plicatilis]|uniref:Uncharacterized protein n=1 Tax=Brachionus plicatilis TaxID=10195 RepID=A0A3M7QNX7_BRAPC|nr:hypothetical protein BpHYR1_043118 [Brachionus plicatilis]
MAVGETKKLFVFEMEKCQLLCQLDQNEVTIELDNIELNFSLKCHNLFVKGTVAESGRLVCHSVKSVADLNGYLNVMAPIMANCLPINAHVNDRVKILLKNKSDEHQDRRNRLKSVWNELSDFRNYSKPNH